jgi:hypothetical protein
MIRTDPCGNAGSTGKVILRKVSDSRVESQATEKS